MNRAPLDQLRQLRCFPSVTLLVNTRPGRIFDDDDRARAQRLTDTAAERLDALVE